MNDKTPQLKEPDAKLRVKYRPESIPEKHIYIEYPSARIDTAFWARVDARIAIEVEAGKQAGCNGCGGDKIKGEGVVEAE